MGKSVISFEQLHNYLLEKKGAVVERPFGPDVRVYKVMGKMFTLLPDDPPLRASLKCDPDEALFLRDMYTAVQSGY
ncbi:MAG: MmcQ/YjbR family DNA-binding protein, partial [Chloroflexi bacterium]|nr:MmcQ/YjbR family DNA-binding protein [Chloroflexota bacterium]